jgi:large subunit ribosomal protein L21
MRAMYAILQHGGHQYRVTSGDRLLVDRLPAEVGSTVTLEHVLMVGDDNGSQVDGAKLADARVTATVVAHRRGRKLRVFTYKAKKRRRRTLGYRSQLTELRVEAVATAGAAPARAQRSKARSDTEKAAPAESKPAAPRAKRATPRKKAGDGA